MAGRSVIADRIEGLAEGWYYEPLEQNTLSVRGKVSYGQGAPNNTPGATLRSSVPTWANPSAGSEDWYMDDLDFMDFEFS